MKKWETIDGVIQMTSTKAEIERRGGDRWRWITTSSVPPLQSRTMRRFPNLSPNVEGSLWRLSSPSSKLPLSMCLYFLIYLKSREKRMKIPFSQQNNRNSDYPVFSHYGAACINSSKNTKRIEVFQSAVLLHLSSIVFP